MPVNTPLRVKHRTLLDKEATEKQQEFYNKFPSFRGVSNQSLDSELLEAVIVAALTFGTVNDRVFVFAPPANEAWMLDQFSKIADVVFAGCMKWPDRAYVARGYGLMFNKVSIIGRPMFEKEPERWLAFGCTKDDLLLPEWVAPRLL